MDLLLILDYVLWGLIFLALWAALRQASQSCMAIALILQLIAIATYLASTAAFEMLSLSRQYTAATTAAERFMAVEAGQAMLVSCQGTAFDVSYILAAVALLIVSIVMLRSQIFSKVIADVGILTSVLMFMPSTAGTLGALFSLLSIVPLTLWLILITRKFFQLAASVKCSP